MLENSILVLDFGSQYTHLIARRVRDLGVYSEIQPYHYSLKKIVAAKPAGIIFSGGPDSVYGKGAPRVDPAIFKLGIPILGICYGLQIMAYELKGDVRKGQRREYGPTVIQIDRKEQLFTGVKPKLKVWMSHFDQLVKLPKGFKQLAHSDNTQNVAYADAKNKLYGIQFHPEVTHTQQGMAILRNYVFNICKAKKNWRVSDFIEQTIDAIKLKVGKGKVICALSGGVDSAVAASLVHKAIGKKLTCIYVDTGLMRYKETESIEKTFRKHMGMNLKVIKAEKLFLQKLKGVTDPERKRKIIGKTFIDIFDRESRRLGKVDFLVQGTLYPDVITSGVSVSKKADMIKSHHNVGGLPARMRLKLIEPLRYLFKDEGRKIGKKLGLPDEIVWRQPFPGPGLAIRIIGTVTKEKLEMLRLADKIVIEEIRKAGLYRKLWQCFAILPGVKTVGIKGDERAYEDLVAIRGLVSKDAMTGDWARLPYSVLAKISTRIPNEVPGLNRVVYDITSKPPAMMEWE